MEEFIRVHRAALDAIERGETIALATVVRVRGSAPRHEGARMLVWPDGRIQGTVGGATLELRVIEHAIQALEARRGRFERYVFSTAGDPESVGLCGGEVDVHIEVLEPQLNLVIVGAGHVAVPLAVVGHQAGMRILVVDDRADFATEERFPMAAERAVVRYDEARGTLDAIPIVFKPPCAVVVTTWGWDEPALAQVLRAREIPEYVGLMASRTKARVIRERLLEGGLSEEQVKRIRAPIGLDLGAETPGEIAVSVVAEILAWRRRATGKPLSEIQNSPKENEAA
jgi:xanthine dehydrogenase accessory factor